jgi:hypothetical protein
MGFLSGLVTGAAQSIDKQLQNDMQRTQERMDGMEQYRVTRRRAKLEEQEKERKEIRDVLNTLAAYTDGDEDRAIQLYNSAGKTVAGGQQLAETLRVNREAGKDIGTIIKYAEAGAAPGNFNDFIERNITPITPLGTTGQMEASGLMKMFGRDLSAELDERVDEAAPLTRDVPEGMGRTAQATIDYTKFLSAEEAAEVKAERERKAKLFDIEVDKFDLYSQEVQSQMDIAERAQQLAEDAQKQKVSQDVIDNLNEKARIEMEKARLGIAQQDLRLRTGKAFDERRLTNLQIRTGEFELQKLENAPQFATHEAMLVAADERLAVILAKPEADRTAQDNADLVELETMRTQALKGIKETADAESTPTYTPSFSKQSVDSIINNEIKRQLQPVGLVRDIEGQLEYDLEGNEVQYFDRMSRALDNVEARVEGISDTQMDNAIQAQRDTLSQDISAYINKNKETAVSVGSEAAAISAAESGQYEPGTVITYTDDEGIVYFGLFTGSELVL